MSTEQAATDSAAGPAAAEPTHTVVRNDEEQYSLWPVGRPVPAGWHETGFRGTADECAAHVDEVWTDMRPRSLREAVGDA